jgi:cell division protein FtsL
MKEFVKNNLQKILIVVLLWNIVLTISFIIYTKSTHDQFYSVNYDINDLDNKIDDIEYKVDDIEDKLDDAINEIEYLRDW